MKTTITLALFNLLMSDKFNAAFPSIKTKLKPLFAKKLRLN